jgi:hypothetical protein
MSEERTITVDPNALKIPDNKSRKKRTKLDKPIKIKAATKPEKKPKASTMKRNLLNLIRKNQEQRMKSAKQNGGVGMKIDNALMPENEDDRIPPKSDFEESVQFLSNLPKPAASPPAPSDPSLMPSSLAKHNHRTFRTYPSSPSILPSIVPSISSPIAETPIQILPPSSPEPPIQLTPSGLLVPPPPYGVLKNGAKPTYRTWRNTTQKQLPSHVPPRLNSSEINPSPIQINYETQLRDQIKSMSEREQHQQLKMAAASGKKKSPFRGKRQKRTVRREHRVGKSKAHPWVSVLVSNKTLRNEANLKKMQLRETPMSEVKRYLRKHGFIKVGTASPNDVLRQMYENARMICGEVHNHNPDNLLYNYFNDIEESFS